MFDVLLFGVYTIGSVVSLMLIKYWLGPAQAAWRAGTGVIGPTTWVAVGAFLYVLSFLTWMVILARNELTVAYPIAIGLTLACSSIGAAAVLGESISPSRAAGMLLIFLGVALVTRS